MPIAAPGWRSGCPVCGYHDKVRLLDAVYQDRELRRADMPPMVSRFGIVLRSHPLHTSIPRAAARMRPPRRPSAVATYIGMNGAQVATLIGIPFAFALLIRLDRTAEFLLSLIIAGVLGAWSGPLSERAQKAWRARTAEFEQAMRHWRGLRYCSRCDQIFVARR